MNYITIMKLPSQQRPLKLKPKFTLGIDIVNRKALSVETAILTDWPSGRFQLCQLARDKSQRIPFTDSLKVSSRLRKTTNPLSIAISRFKATVNSQLGH